MHKLSISKSPSPYSKYQSDKKILVNKVIFKSSNAKINEYINKTSKKNDIASDKKYKTNSNLRKRTPPSQNDQNRLNLKKVITDKILLSKTISRKSSINSMNDTSKSYIIQSIQIKLISNWGNNNTIGLGGIELYTMNKEVIPIIKIAILYESGGYSPRYSNGITRNIRAIPFSNNSNTKVNIKVYYSSNFKIAWIYISNYKGKDKTISTKEISISLSNFECIYADTMKKDGYLYIETGTSANFIPSRQIFVNRRKKDSLGGNSENENNLIRKILCISEEKNNANANSNDTDKHSRNKKMIKTFSGDIKSKRNQCYQCNKIQIVLCENYGHLDHIGLTGIEIYDDGNIVNLSKDIGISCRNLYQYRKIENNQLKNIFNGINHTKNERYMWVTNYNPNNHPYIEITFKSIISLTKIKFYNFNFPLFLNKGLRNGILCLFLNNKLIIENPFILHLGIGVKNIDYSQELIYPFNEFEFKPEELIPYDKSNINLSHWNFHLIYNTPYIPCGYIVQFILLSNYGNEYYIALKNIELYDQFGKEILPNIEHQTFCVPQTINVNNDNQFQMKFINIKLDITIESDNYNSIFFIFNRPICISYIKIQNSNYNQSDMRAKDIKVKIDDRIVFEGEIRNKKEYFILFTGNKDILSKINIRNLFLIGDEFDESFN